MIIANFVLNFLILLVLVLPLLANSVYTSQGFKADFTEFALSPVETVNKSSSIVEGNSPSVSSIDPYFITGFTDAEGCFFISVRKVSDTRTG